MNSLRARMTANRDPPQTRDSAEACDELTPIHACGQQ
jgi:hypothetical protein